MIELRGVSKAFHTSGQPGVEALDDVTFCVMKGEFVIVVAPPLETQPAGDDELDAALDEALGRLSPSRAAAEVADRLKVPRKRAYARALERSK